MVFNSEIKILKSRLILFLGLIWVDAFYTYICIISFTVESWPVLLAWYTQYF